LFAARVTAAAASARVRDLLRPVEPKRPEAEVSTARTTVSWRSSTKRLMKGLPARAVTFQSMDADVVARLVLADLGELDALSFEGGVVASGEEVARASLGGELESFDLVHELFGAHGLVSRSHGLPFGSNRGTRCQPQGTGTVSRTARTMSSGSTPSASAS
jgi:hypothetical protein